MNNSFICPVDGGVCTDSKCVLTCLHGCLRVCLRVFCVARFPWLNPPVGMDRGKMRDFIKGPHWGLQPQNDHQGITKSAWFSDAEEYADLEAPSASGRANARGLAKIMAMLAGGGEVDGVRVMSEAGVAAAISGVVNTRDRGAEDTVNPVFPLGVVGGTGFTNAGWYATTEEHRNFPEPPPAGGFGWAGAGGSSLWFDPVRNIGYAYTITGRRTPCGTQLGGSTERVLNLLDGLSHSAAYVDASPGESKL
jgi:CubicO group peptidase (beta-lactamase class C family)